MNRKNNSNQNHFILYIYFLRELNIAILILINYLSLNINNNVN